jgi:hypothetical protein
MSRRAGRSERRRVLERWVGRASGLRANWPERSRAGAARVPARAAGWLERVLTGWTARGPRRRAGAAREQVRTHIGLCKSERLYIYQRLYPAYYLNVFMSKSFNVYVSKFH